MDDTGDPRRLIIDIRALRPGDTSGLRNLMEAHAAIESGWPGTHVEDLVAFLSVGGELGRWVAELSSARSAPRIVGHVAASTVGGGAEPDEALELWTSALDGTPFAGDDPREVCVEIGRTVIHPEMRGRGVSAPLTSAAVRAVIDAGRVPVASTFTDRAAAQTMMAKHGWVAVGSFTGPRSGRQVIAHIAGPRLLAASAAHRRPGRAGVGP